MKDQELKSAKCSDALRAVMKYRNVNVPHLAVMVDVSERTLEAYTSGKVSLANAKASTVLLIAEYLDVDPFILIGEKSIDNFYINEERRNKNNSTTNILRRLQEKNTVKVEGRPLRK